MKCFVTAQVIAMLVVELELSWMPAREVKSDTGAGWERQEVHREEEWGRAGRGQNGQIGPRRGRLGSVRV